MLRAPLNRSTTSPGGRAVAHADEPGREPGRFGPDRRAVGKWVAVALAIFLVVLLAGGLVFGPLVRSRVAKEGARRRVDVTVASVRPGWFSVELADVRVKLHGVSGLEVRLSQVRVELTATLSVREVKSRGGEIVVEGEPEELVEHLRAFHRGAGSSPEHEGAGRRTPVTVDGLGLSWVLPSDGEIRGSAITLARSADGLRIGCGRIAARYRRATLEVLGGEAELAGDGGARRLSATSVVVGQEPTKASPSPVGPAAPSRFDPMPPPLPPPLPVSPLVAKGRGKAQPAPPAAKAASPASAASLARTAPPASAGVSGESVLPMPDLHAMRARIAALASTTAARVPDGTKIEIGGLSVKLDFAGEPFAFGPGPLTMAREGDLVRVTFASEKGASSTPLSLDAELPLAAGDVTARLSGGPVSLALLGVKEGTKGLSDVGRGTISGKGQLVLSAAGDALTFDGEIALRSISVKQPRLSGEPLRGIDFSVRGRGLLDDAGRLRVDDAQLDMGALHVRAHGVVEETRDHFALSLAADVAPAACQALLDAAPQGLLPTVRSARMSGTFSATSRVVFDTRAIDKLVLDYQIDDRCKMSEVPRELSRDRFTSSFAYRTYRPDGTASETTTGPGTASWTDLDDISPFMISAVLTTEDGAFYKHHGFNHSAIRNSAAANLKARRFVRGASTITMQLTKNLFLSRDKTLSRKIEEVILTDYLEQIFRKDDMMELYLNVIEFGPDVYGVTRAAEYYFGRKPEELNLAECFFLASIMPSPVRYGRLRDKGQVPEGWMKHLRTLMEIAEKNGKVSKAELAEGLGQTIIFVKPGDARPEPRKPVSNGRRGAAEEDTGWQPLD